MGVVVTHEHAARGGAAGQLGHEAGLAHAGRADDEPRLPPSGRGEIQRRLEPGQLLIPADAGGGRRGQLLRHARRRRGRAEQRRVVDEHGPLGGPQRRTRLGVQSLGQEHLRPPVRGQGITAPAQPVERRHQQSPQAFAVPMLIGEPLQLGRDGFGNRRCGQGEQRLRPRLQGGQAQVLESRRLGAGEGLVDDVLVGGATPQS